MFGMFKIGDKVNITIPFERIKGTVSSINAESIEVKDATITRGGFAVGDASPRVVVVNRSVLYIEEILT
jgi:small-conductance mechanosensitive channel